MTEIEVQATLLFIGLFGICYLVSLYIVEGLDYQIHKMKWKGRQR